MNYLIIQAYVASSCGLASIAYGRPQGLTGGKIDEDQGCLFKILRVQPWIGNGSSR